MDLPAEDALVAALPPPPVGLAAPVVQMTETDQLIQILEWIGFTDVNNRTTIVNESFQFFEDLYDLNEKDITTLSTNFSSRTIVYGRVNFGLRKAKKLKSLVHWVQDFRRISVNPSIGIHTQDSFLAA